MTRETNKNYDDFIEVEKDYQVAAIEAYLSKEIRLVDLMKSLGLKRSQTIRKVNRFKADGVEGLQSGRIGKSNNSLNDVFRAQVIDLVREHFEDFGPTFAAEKLLELHKIEVNPSTLRRWMIDEGLWQTKFDRAPRVYSPRMRRERRGELIQVDGSYHRWFEKRGPEACLIVFIDDATSQIMHLRMVDHESSFNYMRCLKWYIEQYGRPLALYSDKHSIFRSTNTDASGNRNPTQFSRACKSLGINVICASSPQAKGRVERSFRTQQDRLIKEMRLAHISTIEEANWFLESYRQKHNAKFSVPALDLNDAHKRGGIIELEQLLTYTVFRKVFKDLTVSFNKIRFILEKSPEAIRAIGKRVTVVVYLNGKIEIFHDENSLPFRSFDKLRLMYEPQIIDRKRLGSAMQMAQAIAAVEPHHFKRNNHIMAGFGTFPQPTDDVSVSLQNATKSIRTNYNGRSRGKLHQHPIVILSQALEPKS